MISYFANLNQIIFSHKALLWLLIPVCSLIAFAFRSKTRPKLSLFIRLVILTFLVLALADPTLEETTTSERVTALIDVSASIKEKGRLALVNAMTEFLPNNRITNKNSSINVYAFSDHISQNPFVISSPNQKQALIKYLEMQSRTLNPNVTNISRSIKEAFAISQNSSLLLLTDGYDNENTDSTFKNTDNFTQGGIFPLLPDEKSLTDDAVEISFVYAPLTANAGDKTEVRVTVRNRATQEQTGALQIFLDNKKLLAQKVTIPSASEKPFIITTPPQQGGLHRIAAAFLPQGADIAKLQERHRWISVKEKAKILLLSGITEDAQVLKQVLGLKGYTVENIVADLGVNIPSELTKYAGVILNNASKQQLPQEFLPNLENYVENGGGLLLIGGDRSFGLGDYLDTPLEKISPLKFLPPQTKKRRLNSAVALLLDKSRSMSEGGKILSAKRSALTAIEALKDDDFVTVIGFDNAPFQLIEMVNVQEAKLIAEQRLVNLVAAGSTHPLTSIALARSELNRTQASRKHIIVLTDGRFDSVGSEYLSEISQAREEGISISTIALGSEADVPFLRVMAKQGGGGFYQTLDADRLPQVFLEDIKVSVGEKTLQEQGPYPIAIGSGGISSTAIERFPDTLGFVETLPKKGATLELVTKKGEEVFPMLASWHYGKGFVAAYTSDANGRWSAPWLRWPNFPKFWSDLIETLKGKTTDKESNVDFDMRYRLSERTLYFDLAVFDPALESHSTTISGDVLEPGNTKQKVTFSPVKEGRYAAEIKDVKAGDYKLEITYGQIKFPPLAVTLSPDMFGEIPGRGINYQALRNLAEKSGGSLNPTLVDLKREKKELKFYTKYFASPLILAFFLVIFEALLRELGRVPLRLSFAKSRDRANKAAIQPLGGIYRRPRPKRTNQFALLAHRYLSAVKWRGKKINF